MKVLLIQLSDIHFTEKDNSILDKQNQLYETIRNSAVEHDKIFILVTGDAAYSGNQTEYHIAKDFINNLKVKISAYANKTVHCVLIPGNHDCNFLQKDNKARQNQINIIQRLGEAAIDDTVIEQCASIQSDFFEFRDGLHDSEALVYSDKLLNVYSYTLGEERLIFYCYNTAYLSEIKEQPGKLYFPSTLLPEHLFNNQEADLCISLFHHPFNWYNPINRREFVSHIHSTSDFYFTGHEHYFSKSMVDDLENNFVYNIEGGVLQESSDKFESSFCSIGFDMTAKTFKTEGYVWNTDKYITKQETAKSISYKRGKSKLKNKYSIRPEYLNALDDVGGKFTHPLKSNIRLEDIYVYPKLRLANSNEVAENAVSFLIEDAENIIKGLKPECRILFYGEENIGKTALLKTAFKVLYKKGYIPIYIDGHEIRSSNTDDFKKLVNKSFVSQYGADALEEFKKEDLNKVFLLVDDIDKNPLKNQKAKGRLISNINKYYRNIILIGNELFTIEEILSDEATQGDLYSNFSQYQILELNYSYRIKLIRRWLLLGREDFMADAEILKKCDDTVRSIELIMGQKVVPNYPIFILILLQALEANSPHDIRASSYASYYQLLILKTLTDRIKDPADLNTYQNYSAELAFFFFQRKTKSLSIPEHLEFHKQFISFEKFDMPMLSADKAVQVLSEAGILEKFNDSIEFKYQYSYYFFVAKYLATNISKTNIRDIISRICERLYRTEFANIIMFLIHFSSDELILNELLKNAKAIFAELEPCRLENDIDKLHQLVIDLPKLYLKNKSVDEVRDEENQAIDKIEEENNEDEGKVEDDNWDVNEDVSEIDIISKLNLSFKLIEILGQTLRSNYGAMTGPIKFEMLKETYLIGLRTLNVFFSIFNDNTDFTVNLLKQMFAPKKDPSDEKVERAARHLLFNICSQMSYVFIKKISDAVGTPNLSDKYPKIQEELNFSSVQLTNFLVKLDHMGFPEKELKLIKDHVEKHPMSYYVLKRMVLNHMHRNLVNYKDKQRICEYLGIDMENQLRIEASRKKEGGS